MRQPTVRLWSIFFNETFRISYCELDKHVGLLRIYFGTIKKNTFLSLPPLPLCPHRSPVPSHLPSVDAAHFLLIVAFFYIVLQPFKAVLYFNVLYFLSPHFLLPYGCETHPHTFRHSRAPSSVPPLAASLILWFIVAFFLLAASQCLGPVPLSIFAMCRVSAPKAAPPARIQRYRARSASRTML